MSVDAAQSRQLAQNPSQAGAEPGVAPAAGQSANENMFMTLLLAQIKNQSPLDPADPAQFASQLVQMSQMKTSETMLAQLQSQGAMLRELQGVALGAQVGQQVLVQTERVRLDGAGEIKGRVTLAGEDKDVHITLTDAAGRSAVVKLGERPAGVSEFSFRPADYGLMPGPCQIALSTAGKTSGLLEMQAAVSGVRLPVNGGEPVLSLAGLGEFPASSLSALLGKPGALSS